MQSYLHPLYHMAWVSHAVLPTPTVPHGLSESCSLTYTHCTTWPEWVMQSYLHPLYHIALVSHKVLPTPTVPHGLGESCSLTYTHCTTWPGWITGFVSSIHPVWLITDSILPTTLATPKQILYCLQHSSPLSLLSCILVLIKLDGF